MKPRIVSWFKTSLASVRPAFAMRQAWREGYGFGQLRQDLMAGAVVGVVAIPLSMALAIASGVPPEHGLYTAIIAGALIALLGGSRVQVSGPTAAFVVILAPISARTSTLRTSSATTPSGSTPMAAGSEFSILKSTISVTSITTATSSETSIFTSVSSISVASVTPSASSSSETSIFTPSASTIT